MKFRSSVLMFLGVLSVNQSFADRTFKLALHPYYGAINIRVTGFRAEDEETVINSLLYLKDRIGEIRQQSTNGGDSRFAKCTAKYSSKDFANLGGDQTFDRKKLNNAYWSYCDFTMAVMRHAKDGDAMVVKAFNRQDNTVGQAYLGKHPDGTIPAAKLEIELNTYNFGSGRTIGDWAGTIYHEILHRVGWDHPSGYEGSMIKEAGLCIARNNADKPLGLVGFDEYRFRD